MPFLEIDNIKINYITGKDGIIDGRKNLIFIHGGGGNYRAWIVTLRYLKVFYNLILVELPGHGKSSGSGEQNIDSYAEWIKKIIDSLALDKCFLIGHSMGGAIALSFSLKYPQTLDGIVLVSTGGRLKVTPEILNTLGANFPEGVKLFSKYAYSDSRPTNIQNLIEKEMLKARQDVVLGDFYACNNFDVLDEINKITIPTLIICGSEDKLTFPKYSHFLHNNINGSKLVIIKDAGHMIMIEKPKLFYKEIEEFICNINDKTIPK